MKKPCLMLMMMKAEVRLGEYQHYKGKFYRVIGVARHSEDSSQEFVVYRALYKTEFGEGSLWIRPKDMFLENVVVDDEEVPRFRFVGD